MARGGVIWTNSQPWAPRYRADAIPRPAHGVMDMRVAHHVVHLVDQPEVGPDTLIALDLSGRHLAFLHQGLDHYLKRSDADPRQWIDPERMSAELAFLMVEEALKGARSSGVYHVLLPIRSLQAIRIALIAYSRQLTGRDNIDLEAVVEQTHEHITNALSIASH